MASLALPQSRFLFNALRLSSTRPLLSSALVPSFLRTALPFAWALPTTLGALLELLPPFVLAVPKKKVSHSRKSMRSANKGLKDKQNIVHCQACGAPKLAHHLCSGCYSEVSRRWKREAKGTATDLI